MTHVEKPESDVEIETTCDMGDCIAVFTVWKMDGELDTTLESVRAKSDETGCFEEVKGKEELYRWKAQLDTPENKEFVLEKYRE